MGTDILYSLQIAVIMRLSTNSEGRTSKNTTRVSDARRHNRISRLTPDLLLSLTFRQWHCLGDGEPSLLLPLEDDLRRLLVETNAEPFQFLLNDALVHHGFSGIQHDQDQIARACHPDHLATAAFTIFGAFDNSGQIQQLNLAKLNSSFVLVPPLRGRVPDYAAPVVVPASKATIEEFCARIHRSLLEQFKHALVWGASVKHGQTGQHTRSGTQGGEGFSSKMVRYA